MDEKNKGLVDNHDGEFILNESGTSVHSDYPKTESKAKEELNKEDKSKEGVQKSESSADEE